MADNSQRPAAIPPENIAIAVPGAAILVLSWLLPAPTISFSQLLLAVCLTVAIALGQHYPVHLRPKTRIYLGTVPIFLSAVLLVPPLAAAVIAVGNLCGELSVRATTRTYLSDVAAQVGRLTVVGYAGSLLAHLAAPGPASPTVLLGVAALMWLGDILTSPLLLGPMTGHRPLTILRSVSREAGPAEAAYYIIGVLGALAASVSLWSIFLLAVPIGLVYLSFKSAMDLHASARGLLAGVVDTSPDAIVLLDLDGHVILANRQAAVLYGYSRPDELHGLASPMIISEEDRPRQNRDLERVLGGEMLKDQEYLALRREGEPFPAEMSWSPVRDKQGKITAVTIIARDITERKRLEWSLRHRARHDSLTGLPNRAVFQEVLDDALHSGAPEHSPFALLVLDLDRFKHVNDTYGHRYGDALLQQAAGRLRGALRDSDVIARLGGDEFGVILPHVTAVGAAAVGARLEAALAEPFSVDGQTLHVGASVGIALYPDHAADALTLTHAADMNMYEMKKARHANAFTYSSRDITELMRTERPAELVHPGPAIAADTADSSTSPSITS